eukprot:3978526-Pleurochrysis_carterae.AAC.1
MRFIHLLETGTSLDIAAHTSQYILSLEICRSSQNCAEAMQYLGAEVASGSPFADPHLKLTRKNFV